MRKEKLIPRLLGMKKGILNAFNYEISKYGKLNPKTRKLSERGKCEFEPGKLIF